MHTMESFSQLKSSPINWNQIDNVLFETYNTNFLGNYQSQKKMNGIKTVYLDEIYKLYLERFAKFCIMVEINVNNHDFYGFLWFHHENRLVSNFHYYVCNQYVKIRKYGKFDGNRKVHLFRTAPLMGFGNFFSFVLNFFFSKNNGTRAKMYVTFKIDLFIRYNFCGKYFFLQIDDFLFWLQGPEIM